MNEDSAFWFVLALLCLIDGVFACLYYPQYRKEIAMLAVGLTMFLFSAWFILVAGLLAAPDPWLLVIGIAILFSLALLGIVLIWRVWFGDEG